VRNLRIRQSRVRIYDWLDRCASRSLASAVAIRSESVSEFTKPIIADPTCAARQEAPEHSRLCVASAPVTTRTASVPELTLRAAIQLNMRPVLSTMRNREQRG